MRKHRKLRVERAKKYQVFNGGPVLYYLKNNLSKPIVVYTAPQYSQGSYVGENTYTFNVKDMEEGLQLILQLTFAHNLKMNPCAKPLLCFLAHVLYGIVLPKDVRTLPGLKAIMDRVNFKNKLFNETFTHPYAYPPGYPPIPPRFLEK